MCGLRRRTFLWQPLGSFVVVAVLLCNAGPFTRVSVRRSVGLSVHPGAPRLLAQAQAQGCLSLRMVPGRSVTGCVGRVDGS